MCKFLSYLFADLPGIASGDIIAFLDPHEEYFRNEKGRGSSVTSYYFEEELLQEKTRDQFMPFHDTFGCNLDDSENYEGTLFRFPLRTTASELSDEGYTKEKVLKLFDSLQKEASVVLLFLKNICSISLHKRSENGDIECIFKVEIAEDSREEVVKIRQVFLSKAAETSGHEISESRYIMNIKVSKDSTTQEFRWLVVNQIGSNVKRISELATKENLPPWIGMALPLDNERSSMDDGRIFCFLPLPPDVDCETGLPVHVHGAFALTDNRRGLVWPGADNQSSTAEWNKLLLSNVAVEVYSKVLHVLLQNSPTIGIDESSRSQLVYSTLPCKAKVKGHWQVILDPLLQKLSKEEWKLFLAQPISGNSWVRLQDGIVDRLPVDNNARETVLRALQGCSQTVITNIPAHVLSIVDDYFPSSRDITPVLLRSVLKTQHDLKASHEDKIKLLEFILEDDPTDDLEGVPLLPLADQHFSTFISNTYGENPSSSVFVVTANCPRSVLPNFDNRFLSEDISTTVRDKLQTLASKDPQSRSTTQLVLMNKEIVLQNLRSCLPVEWFDNINEIVQWMPEKAVHPSESWLEVIWTWINANFPDSLESFIGLPLIQLPAQQLGVLSKHSKFIFASDVSGNSLPDVVVNLLEASGCTVVPKQSSNSRHSDINTYIASATPTGVMTVLTRTSLEQAQAHVKLCTSDERHKLRDFLSRLPTNLDSAQRNLLLRLPLFNTLDGSSAAIQTGSETVFVAEPNFTFPDDFKFRRCNQIISSADTSTQQLLHLLDVKTLNSAEVLVKFLFPDIRAINVYGLDETAKVMLWIIARVFDFKSQCDKFIEEMKNLPFVPTDEGEIVKPSDLYDPGDATILNLFHSEPNKFPRHDYREPHVVSILKDQMGLRTIDKITANDLFQVATCISTSSQLSSNHKLQALVKILNDTPEYLNQNLNSGVALKSELLGVKWLPRATTSQTVCPRFPQSMTWYTCDAQYFTPLELCNKSHALVVGSSMPILGIDLHENVREKLGLTADPPVKQVAAQLKIAIQIWSALNERKICALFKEMIVAIYNRFTRCPKETVFEQLNNAFLEHWIWHGAGFCSPSQIAFKMDVPLDLRPQLYILPEELKDDMKLEQLFLESGVRAIFSEEDIISVLPALKQKHEAPNVPTGDAEKDLKLCRSILEWLVGKSLSESMKENLLFPVESEENILILHPYKECAYSDVDWLRRGESTLDIPDEYPLIHDSVPTKIAISLGVPKLSSCLLSAETLDFDLGIEKSGPNEPITTRIHNILEDYKEGVGVFRELIQNADDAGASKVRFLVDWRDGPKDRLLADGMSECQGPALWAYNDGLFSDKDFENINKLAGATKKQDIATIGRFGLGFNAVYHLTDVPSFVSREYIVMFDPNCHHLQKHITDASQPGIRINLAKFPRPLKIFENQFQPYHGIFDCNMKYSAEGSFHYPGTLFRFPFRTLVQAGKSEIRQKVYDEEKVKGIVESLRESASLLLVYTEHVTEVELFELKSNQKPEQMQPILSVKKTGDSLGNGTPFIKTCSKWWSDKMQDEVSSSECPSKSQYITIDIVESTTSSSGEIEHSLRQEPWLTNSCMGTGSSSALALTSEGREKGLMPFAETAAKLNSYVQTATKIPLAVPGEAFCFLPLSIQTGLPVHINGYFAITSNRRALWEPGTTEHDKPFEGDWNVSLLSDAIACSYIQLLQEIKCKLPEDATKSLQAMLPCYDSLHSTTWEPLVKSVYDKIVNESLAIFWCNGKWLDINSGFILDDDLRNAPGVILTMNLLNKNALDLTEKVCKSFKKAGHEDTIKNRTLTLERFFQELFFPNISRITHDLREPLVSYGLDCILKSHVELEKLFRDNESILNDDGQLKKPAELFDPNDSQLQVLFFQEPGKFPNQDFVANNDSLLSVLKKLGLRSEALITPEELLNVAKTISLSEYSDPLITKSQALVSILQSKPECLSQDVNGCSTLKQELRGIKWLPRTQSPPESCRYPEKMPWFDAQDAFFSPVELRGKSQAVLIGSCMPVVEIIPDSFLVELGIVVELPIENVVEQLSKAVLLWCTDPQMKSTSQFQDLILAIYQYLAETPRDTLSKALKQAELAQWVWHGTGFCSPSQISFKMDVPLDLRPQLFILPEELKEDAKLEQFFLQSGVHARFSEENIISVLPALKQKHETSDLHAGDVEKDLYLCRSILEWLVGKSLSESMKENLLFPVESEENILILHPYKECAYSDVDWLRRGESMLDIPDEYPLIHDSVPTKIAISLGVPKLSSCLLSAEALDFDLGIEKSGPNEPITTRIHNILEDYKEGVGVFRELIQNADDAGASKVRFLVDWRDGPKDRLLADGMSECQGPALWAYNDALFSDKDFENINKLAGATKKQDIATIGRFGLGFNAVYHLTDVPSFVSREYIVMFDPNCHHLQKHITDASQPGIRINLAKFPRPLKIFENQFQPYHGIFDCNMKYSAEGSFHYQGTLFRFPFRTLVQAGNSEICQKVYDEEKVKAIVESLRESASLLLVYTEHVTEVELFELKSNQKPEQMQPILFVKKTGDSLGNGTPFIKTCSKWWSDKMQEELSLRECPSKSQYITIDIVESTTSSSGEIEHSLRQERWLTNSCMGTGSSSALALTSEGREKGLMPFAETAAKLNSYVQTATKIPLAVPGEAFCFLPLSIQTGLPVHINGYFAITSNRRALWEPGTTDHDKPFEGDWNVSLLSDAIACSYIQLLQEIKCKLPEDATKSLQAMLPCYDTLHSTIWEPLVKSVYAKIVNESLAIFWCNGKWLDINSGFILDDDLRDAPGVILTMNSLDRTALDLTEEVCKSFKKAGYEDTIKSRTLTLERFFQELFFPNISRITHELREPLVSYGLDCILKGHVELEKLFRDNESILNDDGQLKKPAELFDPHDSQLLELFFQEPGKFPNQDFVANSDSLLSVLKKLGLRSKALITTEELLNVAKTISLSEYSDPLITKSQALVSILQSKPECLSQDVNGCSTLKQELRGIKWLPRTQSPPESCRYPEKMPWFDAQDAFFSPVELRGKSQALLIGSCMPVVEIIPDSFLVELGIVVELPIENVVEQLSKAVLLWCTDPQMKSTSQFQDLILTIYQQLAETPQYILSKALKQAELAHWVWHGTGFCSPSQISFKMDVPFDLRPQLFLLPEELKEDAKLEQLFLQSGVRAMFSEEDIISVLPALKQKHEASSVPTGDAKKDLKLCRSILEWLVGKSLSESMKENLLFPVESEENILILHPYKECAYSDVDWLRRGESMLDIPDEYPLIHDSVPTKIAISLGVPKLSSCLLSAEALDFDLGIEKSGPNEPITTRIHNILEDYKEGVGIFRELIQNADDAGASKVRFLVDWRVGPKDRLLADGMSECQGPALWAYNDGLFSDKDFENINKLAGATKKQDISTIGRFGLGFNAVYHLTDVPSFVSREYIVMFDPNCHHLQKHITDASQPGIRINLAKFPRPLKVFENQFQPYHGIFDCNMKYSAEGSFHYQGTLFRFPFRTLVQAGKSEICQKVYDEEKVKGIVESLRESASLLLVYTEHVTEVELFELKSNQKPEQMQPILSVKKTGDSLGNGTPFIKTCSKWWSDKMQDEVSSSECPSKSQYITIDIVDSTTSSTGEIEHSLRQEPWLTNSCMGTGSSSALALTPEGREKGLMPFAETAAKINCCVQTATKIPLVVPGEAFCFLPLSIQTGLPVHINGYFAITSNRRALWEPGTTEHDKPFEGDWNVSLLSDAIACSYIQLLQEIKCKLPEDATKSLQAMLPCYDTLHSTTWEPLVKSIYDKIVNESLAIFWCNGKWLDINSGFILDDDLRNAPEVILTMNLLDINVLDLTQGVCKSFKKAGHEDTIKSRTLTLERFFQELFFPNISRITHALREPLVRYGLDCILKGHEELEALFRDNESILNDDGQLKKPAELFDPNDCQLQELFFQEPGKFPNQDFVANNDSLLTVLKKLGLRSKAMIMPEELLNVAKTISLSEYSDPLIKKSQALVSNLQYKTECLSQDVNGCSTLKQELRGIKWLPRARSPPESCRYPEKMPWLDVEDAFFSPDELRCKSQALLIGSCMPVIDIIPDNFLVELGIVVELPIENVVEQLSKAVQLWRTDPHEMKCTSQFQDLILAIYKHLAEIPQDILSGALKQAELAHWVWHETGFACPSQVAMENFLIDLHPHLFYLPKYLHPNEALEEFFVRNGVRREFSKEDIVSVLSSVKKKHESSSPNATENIKHDVELCRFIVEWLVDDGEELSADLQEEVMVPIQTSEKSLIMKPCKDCTFCDHDWMRQGRSELDIPEEFFLIDESISAKTARSLGVKPLSTCLISGEELDFELTGQNEPLTTRLKNILSVYKEGVGVFKELIQNADDAGATKVCFLIDWREGPKKSLFSPSMSECQGPALWAYNDAVFSDSDFKNINKLAGATKKEDLEKIGRFGLGFNAVYHLTDVPSFLSRQYLVVFDPNIQNLIGKVTEAHPGIRIDLAENARPLKTFFDQFQPYHDVFHCNTHQKDGERFNFNGTLFRFPFRTKLQAIRSEISKEVYGAEKVGALVNSLREGLSLILLYTQRVNEVEVYELGKDEDPQAMRLMLSSKKSTESVNLELNAHLAEDRSESTPDAPKLSFIKECSQWWKANCSKTAVSSSPSRSEIISIEVTEQNAEQRKEQWLVSSCMGTDSSLELAMNEGQNDGLLPCGGIAAKLSSDTTPIPEAIFGEAFYFLPLSIATGLPVHVNSSFAIMNNRRSIWERSSSTQQQDLEVRWNECLMSDALCNAYMQLLETMKSLCENGALQNYPFHVLWPCYNKLESSTWKTLVNNVYMKLVGNSLPLLRSNGTWLDINSGYILADDLREAPKVAEAMQCLNENVFEMPEDVCTTLKECGQGETLQERTLTLERFFTEFFFPNMLTLSHEVRNPLVQFGLDCILAKQEELESLFTETPCIPCSEDRKTLVKPSNLINPNGAAAELFLREDNRFPVGEEFLTKDRIFVLEKLGMKTDVLSWEVIYERARSVEVLAEICYDKALLRSRKIIEYLNKFINKLVPSLQKGERTIQDIRFLPFIKEPPKDYKNGLPWKGLERKKEQFCSPTELFVPHHMDLVGSCCLILSTHDSFGCGKPEKNVKDVLGMSHQHASCQQVFEQLDNIIQVWSTFNKDDREKNRAKVLKICHCIYEYLDKYFAKVVDKKDEEPNNGEEELLNELVKREWLFINDTFVSSDKVACYWLKNGAPYLYGVPATFTTEYKSLLQMTNVKERFDAKDFLDAINSLKESKGCTALTDGELEVAVSFLNELKEADEKFFEGNSDQFYLPDESKVLAKADELTINSTPWLLDRGDSRNVHKDITPDLAFKLGAKSLLDKRLGKYSKTLGTPFGQHEKLTDRLKNILTSYPCDSGILKELVQNADDAQATEIHFIYDKRTLPCNQVFQNNAEEIQGPALCVYNNRAFSESDLEGIQKLGIGNKGDNAEKTGQFGIGFNAVYHLTDCPSFISNGETLCVLDPHCRYAPGATSEYPGERFDPLDQEFKEDFKDTMKGYLMEFGFNLQDSTMFRLPLRSAERSKDSHTCISQTGEYRISSLLDEFKGEAKRSMLFLNHVKKISISEIDSNDELVKKYEVISNVDKEDMKKLGTLLSDKKEFKNVSTKDILWHGVTCPLVLGDTHGCIEHWLVHQCYGVKTHDESGEIPDGRDYKLLPHGGLAALIESNQRPTAFGGAPRYFAYCFLPLPVRTSLPVHVNGHFALDPGRRDLWKDADSKDPLAQWNAMIKENVLAPGYANLILEARKYMQFCEREGEDKTSCFFPGKASAEAGLSWYHNFFPNVLDDSWFPLTLALYAFLANNKKPVLPVVVADEPKANHRPDNMPWRIRRWFPVQDVFFVNKYKYPENPEVTDSLMKIFLEIQLPVAGHSPISVQQGFEKAGSAPRVVSPESVVLALRNFSFKNAECNIGALPCKIEDTTISCLSKLRKLITYCKRGENFRESLTGLPLLLTADGVLRVFSQEEKVYCSKFSDLFPRRAHKFVHPEIVSYLSSVLNIDKPASTSEGTSDDSSIDTTITASFPKVLLPLTTDVVDTFMSDFFPEDTKNAKIHLDFGATGVSEEWLKRLWVYLQTYSKEVDDRKPPLDALKAWPIIPTTSNMLVTVEMAKTVIDMTLVGNEGNAAKKVLESLKKLNCPCLDTSITLPEQESGGQTLIGTFVSSVFSAFSQPTLKKEPLVAVTESYVAHPHNVSDILNVFDFILTTESLDAADLSHDDITGILQFIQDGYENLYPKANYNAILKQLPFYKSINGKHYKLSEFSEYAVIPADVPHEEIDKLQEQTRCLFLHSCLLPTFEKLLTELDAGAKRTNAHFYRNYILPNFAIFSDKMRLKYLIHIRDKVIPSLKNEPEAKDEFLKDLKRTTCIPNKNGEYVHASQFYDPRNKVFRIMEDESSDKFPPAPFNETEWLDFLVLIGMIKDVDETLFMKFASRVAKDGNSSPNDETNRERSKALLNFFFTNHHLHNQRFLCGLSTIKFIASQRVEDVYLSLYRQYCCAKRHDHPPFVQFSNAVLWKYRSLVWTSANLLPEWKGVFCISNEHQECKIESLYKNLEVKYPSPDMVISHLQNISGMLAESSKKEQALPQNLKLTTIMNNIYKFLHGATKCLKPEISPECSNTCIMIGNRLASTQCILVPVDNPKAVVKGDQLSFKIREDKSLVPFIYEVPREYGNLQHLLKRLGATETITPLQVVSVFKKIKNRIKDNELNPQLEKKAQNAMFLLFESVLNEAKDENKQSSIANVQELYLPSEDRRLIESSELLCKIPPRHIETVKRLRYRALCFFETCGLQTELENKYLEALPAKLRPKSFKDVVKETLDESCLEKPCQLCKNNADCEFIKKLKVLLKSEDFKNGIIRLLKHQNNSSKLSQEDEQAASRLFLNKVEIKCMETVQVHLLFVNTNEVLEGSSTTRKCFVVERPRHDVAWTLYMKRGDITTNLANSINKILNWRIKERLLLAVFGMLRCTTPLEIPEVLNGHDIKVDAGKNEEVKLGSNVPVVFHQLLEQNPLFVFYAGELVAYCAQLPYEGDQDGESHPITYILAEIIKCLTSNSAEGEYDFEARFLIDIGGEKREVSVLDLYKFYQDYPDENSCKDLVPFTGDVVKKPETYDEAKREILEALRAAWRLPPDLRRKAIRRLYLRWHPDKNPNNVEFATEMMAFLLEQIRLMKQKEKELTEKPENFNFDKMFKECNRQASRDNATFDNYRNQSSHGSIPTSGFGSSRSSTRFHYNSAMFDSAEAYTSPNPGEAKRWIEQAEGDLSTCQCLRTTTKPFDAMACFLSQQIVEKSLKAALYYECGLGNEQLHTHDIYSLATNVNNLKRWKNDEVVHLALEVANYYLPTRYPNQLSYPKVPHSSFDGESRDASQSAAKVLQLVKEFIRN